MDQTTISRADWQLPLGVDRGLWTYLNDAELARQYDASLADAPLTRVDRAFAESHFDSPGRLIDLGCGTGRLLIPFARRGYWVLGVDLSPAMLSVFGAQAADAGVSVHRLQANLVELDAVDDRSFDYAVCLFNTLGMIQGPANRARVIGHVHRILRTGGKFVLHVHNRWFNFWNRPGRAWLLRDACRSLFTGCEAGNCKMPAHASAPAMTMHVFTRHAVLRLLGGAGFRPVEIQALSLRPDGRLDWPAWFGWLRAYGYLIAVEKQ